MNVNDLKGQLWVMGQTREGPEDPLKRSGQSLGREWFAITAFPLFAGTFGTIASMLNILALVQPWRCVIAMDSTDIKNIDDPAWLIGLNAMSLVFGILANISIMFVMGRGPPPLRKLGIQNIHLILITILAGFIASFILISLVIAASVELRLPSPPQHSYTESFFYAIMSAVLYFITSAFVVYTAYMVLIERPREDRKGVKKEFGAGYRSLKLLTIAFMAYMLLGAAVYSKIEGWRYADAVFWADVTILTVGFGDYKPETVVGQALLFPYATVGVCMLFLVIYYITRVVFDRGTSIWEIRLRDHERLRKVQQRDGQTSKRKSPFVRLNEKATAERNGLGPEMAEDHLRGSLGSTSQSKEEKKKAEREARRRDFNLMQEALLKATRKRIFYSMALWGLFAITLWVVGAVVFYVCERDQSWDYFTALYFTFISLLAIGYGDNGLVSMAGKSFFVLWSLIVVPTLTMLISTVTEAVALRGSTGFKAWVKRKVLRRQPPRIKKQLSASLVRVDQLPHNTHDKNHLLVQAIKNVALEHIANQRDGRRPDYSFEDWEYIFYLMGALESPFDQQATATESDPESKRRELDEAQDEGPILDWLHGKNPLNVSDTLTEWLLLTLVEKLETELSELRRQMGMHQPNNRSVNLL